MVQVARALTGTDEGFLAAHRVLVCDRDTKWSWAVRQLLEDAGVRVVQTPYRAPNANARAERFVRSITTECLVKVIPFGERHFRRTLTDFVAHDHGERSHQGLGSALIDGPTRTQHQGRSRRRRRLGGVLDYDYRAA